MSAQDARPILARILAAHTGAGPGQADLKAGLQAGLSRAIRRASVPFATLAAQVAEVEVSIHASLTDAVNALPSHGLVAAIEDEDGRRGLVAVEHSLVDALIEVQTTGHVEDVDLAPRPVTRIDEALCRDFLDLLFASFAQETAKTTGRDWPDRMAYGSIVVDQNQLNLLLPEQGYHLLKTSVTAGGRKTGQVLVLLPSDPSLARRHAAKVAPGVQTAPVDWSKDMLRALGAAPMALDAILMRVVMPLGEVEALEVGDLVPFDHSDLSHVQLEGEGGHIFAKGALGQQNGRRAFRIEADTPKAAPPPAPTIAPAPMPTAAPTPTGLPNSQPVAKTPELPALANGGFNSNAAPGVFDPNAAMGGFDPNAPMGDFDPNAPMV